MSDSTKPVLAGRIFDERRHGAQQGVVLPWKRTLEVCWSNIRHRMGRCILTFVCIAVVVLGSFLIGQGVEEAMNPRLGHAHVAPKSFRLRRATAEDEA